MILSADSGNSAEKDTCFKILDSIPIKWLIDYGAKSGSQVTAAEIKGAIEHFIVEKYDSDLAKKLQGMQAKCRPNTLVDKLEIKHLDKQELNMNEQVGQFVAYAGNITDSNNKKKDDTKDYDTRRNVGVAAGGECQQTPGYPNFEFSWPNWSANSSRG